MFLKHSKPFPARGPLHFLFPLPGILFSQIFAFIHIQQIFIDPVCHFLISFKSVLKCLPRQSERTWPPSTAKASTVYVSNKQNLLKNCMKTRWTDRWIDTQYNKYNKMLTNVETRWYVYGRALYNFHPLFCVLDIFFLKEISWTASQ